MPLYDITVPVERASGYQVFRLVARSPADALARFRNGTGDAEIVFEEVEVTDLGGDSVTVKDVQLVEVVPPAPARLRPGRKKGGKK